MQTWTEPQMWVTGVLMPVDLSLNNVTWAVVSVACLSSEQWLSSVSSPTQLSLMIGVAVPVACRTATTCMFDESLQMYSRGDGQGNGGRQLRRCR
jgi:hypothetical protein